MSDFPASTRVYTPGTLHQSVRVPFRDIALKDNSSMRVYDTRGPWGDPDAACDVRMGLSPCARVLDSRSRRHRGIPRPEREARRQWVPERQACRASAGKNRFESFPGVRRRPRRPSRRRGDAAPLRAEGHHHSGDGVCRDPRKPRTRARLRSVAETGPTSSFSIRANPSERKFPTPSLRNLSATKSPEAARSFPRTSITWNWSR